MNVACEFQTEICEYLCGVIPDEVSFLMVLHDGYLSFHHR